MAAVPTPPAIAPGIVTSSTDSQLAQCISFLMNPPRAELRQTVTQTFTTSVYASLAFDTTDIDANPAGTAQHSNSTNNSRFTAVYAGRYLINGGCTFLGNTSGVRDMAWAINGTQIPAGEIQIVSAGSVITAYTPRGKTVFLNVGDYLELQAFQNSGGNLGTSTTLVDQPNMSVLWVATS